MKQFITILAITILTAVSNFAQAQNKVNVVASASMWADMVANIGGDKVAIDRIVPIGGDPHTYEPTPSDAIKVSNADLILINGLTFEGWINDLIDNSGTKAETVLVTKYVTPISSDDYENATDPHAWMDADNGRLYAKAIYEALVKKDPENGVFYTQNYEAYDKKVVDLDNYIKAEIEKIPADKRILVTSHDAFKYYGNAYGIQLEAIQGISTEAEAQLSDMTRVTEVIKKTNIPAIFVESTINPKMLQQIAKDNNIAIGGELFADSLGKKGGKGGTYISMLKHNTDVIVKALSMAQNTEITEEKPTSNTYLYLALGIGLVVIMALAFTKLTK
jgi:ABC-type Zn uptake system ZnuABC Zn-binding protein ZnuA